MSTTLTPAVSEGMTLSEIVADNVRAFAGRRRLTRSELARMIGMHNTAAGSRWRGEIEWRLSELPSVANALGVSIDDLMTPPRGVELRPRQDSNLQPRDWRVKLAARLSVELGMRRGEVACVNVDRDLIDSSDGAALIVHGKGGKTRVIPITESLAGELRKYRGFVFPGNIGGHISPEWLGKLLSRSMPAGVSMHALRHRFTTRAYRATRDLVAVQRVLGHASPETTLVYLQMSDDALRRVVEAAA